MEWFHQSRKDGIYCAEHIYWRDNNIIAAALVKMLRACKRRKWNSLHNHKCMACIRTILCDSSGHWIKVDKYVGRCSLTDPHTYESTPRTRARATQAQTLTHLHCNRLSDTHTHRHCMHARRCCECPPPGVMRRGRVRYAPPSPTSVLPVVPYASCMIIVADWKWCFNCRRQMLFACDTTQTTAESVCYWIVVEIFQLESAENCKK